MTSDGRPHHDDHPSPHRDRVSIVALLFGLAIGPAAWAAQLMIGYGVSSYACFPGDEALRRAPPPGWGGERVGLAAVEVVCLILALSGLWTAYGSWRASREEKAGSHRELLDVGEGRTRFLAGCGILVSLGFALAILFDVSTVIGVPSCWEFGR